MLHPLIVSKDLMRAMRQHRDILSTNPTIEMTQFASCIGSPSHKKLTHVVRPPHIFLLECALWPHTTTGMTGFWFIGTRVTRVGNMWTRTCTTLPQMLKNGIQFSQQENTVKRRNLKSYNNTFWDTYFPSVDQKSLLSLQRRTSGIVSPTYDRWPSQE